MTLHTQARQIVADQEAVQQTPVELHAGPCPLTTDAAPAAPGFRFWDKDRAFAAAMAKLDGEITAAHASLGHDPWKAYYNSDGSVGGTLNGGGK